MAVEPRKLVNQWCTVVQGSGIASYGYFCSKIWLMQPEQMDWNILFSRIATVNELENKLQLIIKSSYWKTTI